MPSGVKVVGLAYWKDCLTNAGMAVEAVAGDAFAVSFATGATTECGWAAMVLVEELLGGAVVVMRTKMAAKFLKLGQISKLGLNSKLALCKEHMCHGLCQHCGLFVDKNVWCMCFGVISHFL